MKVQVKLFAVARDAVGRDTIAVNLGDAPTVAELRAAVASQYPNLANVVSHSMFAIDTEYSADERQIPAGATIVCIPPVSGG